MAQEQPNVVNLPILKGSSIVDAMSGFAAQIDKNEYLGRRVERAVTTIAAEFRGWEKVVDRIGTESGAGLLGQLLERAAWIVESAGGAHIGIAGTATAPVLTATFPGDQHAIRALVAAQRVRDVASRTIHPSLEERFHACIGVNSGTLAHTRVNGSGVEFSATGTVRMFATRLQEFAGPDQIFLAASTVRAVPVPVTVVPIGSVRTNGDGEQQEAYCLLELVSDGAER